MIDYSKLSLQELQEQYDFLDEDSQMSDAYNTWKRNRYEMQLIRKELKSRYANL